MQKVKLHGGMRFLKETIEEDEKADLAKAEETLSSKGQEGPQSSQE